MGCVKGIVRTESFPAKSVMVKMVKSIAFGSPSSVGFRHLLKEAQWSRRDSKRQDHRRISYPALRIGPCSDGGGGSMTRRVPEYQMRVTEANGHTRNKELNGRSKREPISFARARQVMVFQIMQVVSAPMIALTAYYLILPDTRATSVIIAFVSGFASETILRLLRIASDGLTEKLDTAKSGARA